MEILEMLEESKK